MREFSWADIGSRNAVYVALISFVSLGMGLWLLKTGFVDRVVNRHLRGWWEPHFPATREQRRDALVVGAIRAVFGLFVVAVSVLLLLHAGRYLLFGL